MISRLLEYQRLYGSLKGDEYTAHTRALETDHALRKEVKELARYFLNREVSNCGWCYIELDLQLRKITNMTKKTMDYALFPGTILHDPINKSFDLILMPPKLTEGLALYHLAFNPRAAKYFLKVPLDVDKRIADYLSGLNDEMKARALPSAIAALEKFAASTPESEKGERATAKPKAPRRSKDGAPSTAKPADESPAEQGEE